MREIKFRGKMIDSDEWIYGWLRQSGEQQINKANGQYIKTEKYYQIQNEKYKSQFVQEHTIGQYTGLKDKNGTEIYEGDIVKANWFDKEKVIGEIYFSMGCFILANSSVSDNQLFIFKNLEVIGNIYDNPKLLKGE